MSFGSALRTERERANTSLDQLAEATKLPPKLLRALEADDFAALPGGIFNKGMVRSYCRVLGLNEDRWLQRLAGSLPAPAATTKPEWAEFAENVSRNRSGGRPAGMALRWFGVLLMVLGVIVACALTWHFALRPRLGTSPAPQNSQTARIPQ